MASSSDLTAHELRLLTSTSPEFPKMSIETELLERHCPLDNGRLERRGASPSNTQVAQFDTGNLGNLPVEINLMILSFLDLRSLTELRAVCWGSRALVDSMPQYASIIQHCPNALRVLLSTNMATHFTLPDLFETLCTQACFRCGYFGGFLDQFSCRRYCLVCAIVVGDLLSMPTSSDIKEFALNDSALRALKLPARFNLPGNFMWAFKTPGGSISLNWLRSVSCGRRKMRFYSPRWGRGKLYQSLPLPKTNLGRLNRKEFRDPPHFMPMLKIPALDERTGELDWGVSCQVCRLLCTDGWGGQLSEILYSAAGYLEHFQTCDESQDARKFVSDYVTDVPEDRPRYYSRFLERLTEFYTDDVDL